MMIYAPCSYDKALVSQGQKLWSQSDYLSPQKLVQKHAKKETRVVERKKYRNIQRHSSFDYETFQQ